jgi:hypothetical protein
MNIILHSTYLVALGWILASSVATAATLQQGKPTDESVCDLGPETSAVLAQTVLVPARAEKDQQAEAYSRLASRFVSSACANGQILILHSKDANDTDSKYLPGLAGSLCVAADVTRQEVTSRQRVTNEPVVGFELRCRIKKFAAFKADVDAREKADPTDAFVIKVQQDAVAKVGEPAGTTGQRRRDCEKMTLSSVLTGGSCR